MADIKCRYEKQDEDRFSDALKYAVWKAEPANQDSRRLDLLTGASAKRNCLQLKSNLEQSGFIVENSVMWKICDKLSHSDYFQTTDIWLEADIEVTLSLLRQESSKNAAEIAHSFRKADKSLREGRFIGYAFAECVPATGVPATRYHRCNKIQRILNRLPDVYNRDQILRYAEERYKRKGFQKFSASLKNIFWKMSLESTHQGRPSDAGAVSSASDEERPWFKRKPAQEHCGMLEAQLRQKAMTVENSSMLFLCRELSRHDCDLDTNFLVRTDIKTVLYLLCQKSLCQKIEMPSDELAEIFRKEDDKLNQREMLHALCQPVPKRPPRAVKDVLSEFSPQAVREMLHALGRSVPQMQPQAVKDVLFDFPSQAVIDTYFTFPGEKNRYKILEDIKKRYTEKKDAERFQPLLDNILALVESDEEGEELCPERSDFSSISADFVPQFYPPMQSGVMVYPSAYQSPQPFLYPMSVALVQPCYPSMQSAVAYQHSVNAAVMPQFYSPPQVLQQQMRGSVMNPACAR